MQAGRTTATPKPSKPVCDAYFASPAKPARPSRTGFGRRQDAGPRLCATGVKQRLAARCSTNRDLASTRPCQEERRPGAAVELQFQDVRDYCRLAYSTPGHTGRSKLSRKTRHGWQPSTLTDARGERGGADAPRACKRSLRGPWQNSRRTYGARIHSAGNRGDRSCRPTRPANGCDDAAPFDAGVPHAHGDGAWPDWRASCSCRSRLCCGRLRPSSAVRPFWLAAERSHLAVFELQRVRRSKRRTQRRRAVPEFCAWAVSLQQEARIQAQHNANERRGHGKTADMVAEIASRSPGAIYMMSAKPDE